MSPSGARRWPLFVAAALGVGLVLAPVAFDMFERAPKGGDMIDGFGPYMTTEEIGAFRDHLADIGAAQAEVTGLRARLGADSIDQHAAVTTFERDWPAIGDDMGSMLSTMEADIGKFEGVVALPPFPLFPWFFVVPGVLVAAIAVWSLRTSRPLHKRGSRFALMALGAGLVAAPAVFQMFTRAPGGAVMIEDFEPFMTTEKVTRIQGYFLVIGAAEGQLRREAIPGLTDVGAITAGDVPAIVALTDRWPAIAADMAPMIGAMADNVDNFAAVDALPPFWLFPWFFVVPGLALVALAAASRPARPTPAGSDVNTCEPYLEGVST